MQKKYTRKTVNIKSKKLLDYISIMAEATAKSESSYIEEVLMRNMEKEIKSFSEMKENNDNSVNIQRSAIYIRDKIKNEIHKTYLKKIEFSMEVSIPIPDGTKIINRENKIDISYLNRNLIEGITNEAINMNDYLAEKERLNDLQINYSCGKEQYIVPIFFINISNIRIIDNQYKDKAISENFKDEKTKLITEEKRINLNIEKKLNTSNSCSEKYIDEAYNIMEENIDSILIDTLFFTKATINGWFILMCIDGPHSNEQGYYNYLNIRYQRFNNVKENNIYLRKNFICLLKGRSGFLYCDLFDYPRPPDFFIKRHNDILNKKNMEIEQLSTTRVKDNAVINFMRDIPKPQIRSKLLQVIINIKKKKEEKKKNRKGKLN